MSNINAIFAGMTGHPTHAILMYICYSDYLSEDKLLQVLQIFRGIIVLN